MSKSDFIIAKKTVLKNRNQIIEKLVQDFIFENPSVLGLGPLGSVAREKKVSSGGILDMVLEDSGTRYEVEVQLGKIDESHIVRAIEYWDLERNRYPQYDHCAVIIAEEVTGRFMNVVSLFNRTIPLIVIQMTAIETENGIILDFIKIMDRPDPLPEEEETIPADRAYWVAQTREEIVKLAEEVLQGVSIVVPGFTANYKKQYVGLSKDGISRNFVYVVPKRKYIYLFIKCPENQNLSSELENSTLDYDYLNAGRMYRIKLTKNGEYTSNKAIIDKLVNYSAEYFGLL